MYKVFKEFDTKTKAYLVLVATTGVFVFIAPFTRNKYVVFLSLLAFVVSIAINTIRNFKGRSIDLSDIESHIEEGIKNNKGYKKLVYYSLVPAVLVGIFTIVLMLLGLLLL